MKTNLPKEFNSIQDKIKETPWDSKVFGIDTFEIFEPVKEVFDAIQKVKGHYTVKVDPLFSNNILKEYGFYYCDTLIVPVVSKNKFIFFENLDVSLIKDFDIEAVVEGSKDIWQHGRFHKDPNIDNEMADLRHANWVRDIYLKGNCFVFLMNGELAGFFGFEGNKIVLHALFKDFQGKGLAKYFWSIACKELFDNGNDELSSSISVSNIPVLNLYRSLGFAFKDPRDVYHCLIK